MPPKIEVWAGLECTIARIGDDCRDQLAEACHHHSPKDLVALAELGVRTLRYPVLWERIAPKSLSDPEWDWHDLHIHRMAELGLNPILGLVHHGSGPFYTNLLDPEFPFLLARFAQLVAQRYPHITAYTPVNEPLTTARFSCLYGFWYPHKQDADCFLRALANQCYGVALAQRAIRETNPHAKLIQTDDFGRTFSTPSMRPIAEYYNARRWLGLDLLCGRVNQEHRWFERFLAAGVSEALLSDLVKCPCPPDIIGLNYYLSSDRYLDERRERYPRSHWGNSGGLDFADVEAVRAFDPGIETGFGARLRELWDRYRIPVAITEVHNGCTREEQLRWLLEAYHAALHIRDEGVDVRAITAWAAFGSIDWDSLLVNKRGRYEPGLFDTRGGHLRPTALAHATKALAGKGRFDHPVLDSRGWWHREDRFFGVAGIPPVLKERCARGLMICGASGTLAQAFKRICTKRGLAHLSLNRAELDITDKASVDRAIQYHRPWAVINAAGFVRVADAGREWERCFKENSLGPANLAQSCARHGIPLVIFSSDRVFDGTLGRPYLETDPTCPADIYGASKAEAEKAVGSCFQHSLIIRTSAFFGPWDKHNFIFKTILALGAGNRVSAAGDCTVSPTYVPDLVDAVLDLLLDGESGVRHLANAGAISWAELARTAARRIGSTADRVVNTDLSKGDLNTALGTIYGQMLPPFEDALKRYFDELDIASLGSSIRRRVPNAKEIIGAVVA